MLLAEYLVGELNPTQKSMDEARWLIRHFSVPGDTVYSIFDGTGTYTIAALLEGRSALSVDRDDRQQQHARARVCSLKEAEQLRTLFWEKYTAYDEGPERFRAAQLQRAAQVFGEKSGSPSEELVYKALKEALGSTMGVMDETGGNIVALAAAKLDDLVSGALRTSSTGCASLSSLLAPSCHPTLTCVSSLLACARSSEQNLRPRSTPWCTTHTPWGCNASTGGGERPSLMTC